MKFSQKQIAISILKDIREELEGYPSNKPEGEGVTSNEYLTEQVMKLQSYFEGFILEQKDFCMPKAEDIPSEIVRAGACHCSPSIQILKEEKNAT